MGLRTTAGIWNAPNKYGPQGELFFLNNEPVVLRETVDFGHCIPVETFKACAMCGLHMMDEEKISLSRSSISPYLGDMLRYGCRKSAEWNRDVDDWTESEGTSFL